jgi:hypothetical protein
MTPHYLSLRLIVCFLSLWPFQNAIASSLITLTPAGAGSFFIQGAPVEGAGAIEITLAYDAALLGNPQVIAGPLISGAMMAANSTIPGIVRVAIIHTTPISGSGNIATLTFERHNIDIGQINSLHARLTGANGAALAVVTHISSVPQSPNDAVLTPLPFTPTSTTPQSNTLPMVQESFAELLGTEAKRVQDGMGLDLHQNSSEASGQLATSAVRAALTQKSTLDRFKDFEGKPSVALLVSLFDESEKPLCRQTPTVVLTDGQSAVTIHPASVSQGYSDLVVMGAKLIDSNPTLVYTNRRAIKLLPEKDVHRASVSFTQGGANITCPLTVAPKANIDVDHSGSVTEADLRLFLKARGAKEVQLFDMNKDGKLDYLDDYIFTANYLVKKAAGNYKTGNHPARDVRKPSPDIKRVAK